MFENPTYKTETDSTQKYPGHQGDSIPRSQQSNAHRDRIYIRFVVLIYVVSEIRMVLRFVQKQIKLPLIRISEI